MIRIHFIPAGDIDTASSRLRVFGLAGSLNRQGVTTSIGQQVPFSAEVVVIQKRVTSEILYQAVQAKSRGALVVYDVDDSGNALWYWTPPRLCKEMVDLADLVTVDTQVRADWLRRVFCGHRVVVLLNPIDYEPSQPVIMTPAEKPPLRILWFGSVGTFESFSRYAEALACLANVRIVVCSGRTAAMDNLQRKLSLELVPWTRESFIEVLQSCDLSCLMHDGTLDDRRKSNHKMITSICWGVPAIVSDTPEYGRTAREANVQDAVFSSPEELLAAVERYRTAASRRSYLAKSQVILWRSYSPQHIAGEFLRILAEAKSKPPNLRQSEGLTQGRLGKSISYIVWRWHLEDDRRTLIRNWMRGLIRRGNDT